MRRVNQTLSAASGAMVIALLASTASAQQAPAAPPEAQNQPATPPVAPAETAPSTPTKPDQAPSASTAQPPSAQPPLEVVVSGTRNMRDVFNSPVGVSLIRRKDIEQRPSPSPADLVRDQPGVWTNGEGLLNVTPNLRGAFGNQTLLMLDGTRINNINAFSGPNSWFQTIDVENIERIEIIRGPGSVMWGSDALGGMIHVFTRTPPEWTETGTRMTGRFSATYGSADRMQRFRGEAGAATPEYRLRAGITSLDVGDLHTAGSLGVMSPSGWSGRAVDGRFDLRVGPRGVLIAEAHENRISDGQAYETTYSRPQVTDNVRRLALVRYEVERPAKGLESFQTWAYVQTFHDVTRQLNDGKETANSITTLSFDAQARSRLSPDFSLTYGAHYHTDGAQSITTNRATQGRGFPDSRWHNGAAFVLAEASPFRKLTVLAGARADLVALKSSPDALSVPAGLTIDEMRVNDSHLAPTGSLGLVGHMTPWLNLVASAGRGFRAPNVADQLRSGAFRNGYNYPSPGLHPESSWNFEGGARVKVRNSVSASVTGFYTRYDDLIQSQLRNPDLNSSDCVDTNGNGTCDANEHIYVKRNVGTAHTYGVEAMGRVELPYHITPFVVGTLMTGRVDKPDGPMNYLPPANATVGVRYEPRRFYVELAARLVAPVSSDNIVCSNLATDAAFHVDPRDVNSPLLGSLKLSDDKKSCSGSYPGHVTLGLRAGANVTSYADVNVSVQNLTNTNYRDKDARFDGPGLGAFGTVTLHPSGDVE